MVALLALAGGVLVGVALALAGRLAPGWRLALGLVNLLALANLLVAHARAEAARHPAAAIPVVLVALAAAWMIAAPHYTFAEPYYTMRDQVVYSLAPLELARTGGLEILGPEIGSYLGFRAIGEGVYSSHFLPGYFVFISTFEPLFGLRAHAAAGAVLVAFTAVAASRVAATLGGPRAGSVAPLLLLGSYAVWWFGKGSWSENLQGALVWGGIACALQLAAGLRLAPLAAIAAALGALFLSRPESNLYLLTLAVAVLLVVGARLLPRLRAGAPGRGRTMGRAAVVLGVGALILLAGSGLRDWYAQTQHSVYLDKHEQEGASYAVRVAVGAAQRLGTVVESAATGTQAPPLSPMLTHVALFMHYEVDMLLRYGMVLLGLAAAAGLFTARRPFHAVVVALAAAPSLYFVILPSVYADQPWFLRRYYAILLPLLATFAAVGVAWLAGRLARARPNAAPALTVGLALLLVLPAAPATASVARGSEYEGLGQGLASLDHLLTAAGAQPGDPVVMLGGLSRYAPAMRFIHGWSAIQDRGERAEDAVRGLRAGQDAEGQAWIVRASSENPLGKTRYFSNVTYESRGNLSFEVTTLRRAAVVPAEVFENATAYPEYGSWITDYENVPPSTWHTRVIKVELLEVVRPR